MIKVKTKAKINLTLDVKGKENGYHKLDSLVCSASLYNVGVFKKRRDKKLNIIIKGEKINCPIEKSNAYLAGKKFIKKFNTFGADVILKRNIPTFNGLGGSSSDIATVLSGLNKLYNVNADLKPLANEFSSDGFYMLNGGFKRLKGRGDTVEEIPVNTRLYFNILTSDKGVSTKECFIIFDKGKGKKPCTEKVLDEFYKGKTDKALSLIKNDLYNSAKKLLPDIEEKYTDLKSVGNAVMTGSGSAVIGVYKSKKERNTAYKKLKEKYKNVIKLKSV